MIPPLTHAAPFTHVADVARTVAFYEQLGCTIHNTHRAPDGTLVWAMLTAGKANLMFALASDPIDAGQQAVLFYLYSSDLVALRQHLLDGGIKAPAIKYPFYMEKGELRITDPDGYVLLIGQSG